MLLSFCQAFFADRVVCDTKDSLILLVLNFFQEERFPLIVVFILVSGLLRLTRIPHKDGFC